MNASEAGGASANTMRALNPGYYLPTEDEYRKAWEAGLIAVDASVLLSLYRYSGDTRDQLLELLKSFSDRLWLPHQAASEYERNRLTVIGQQLSAYDQLLTDFGTHIDAISNEFRRLVRHPLLDQDQLAQITSEYERKVTDLVEETRAKHPPRAETQEDLLTDGTREALEQPSRVELAPRIRKLTRRRRCPRQSDEWRLRCLPVSVTRTNPNLDGTGITCSGVKRWTERLSCRRP